MRILTVDVHIDELVRFETFGETKAVFTLGAWVQNARVRYSLETNVNTQHVLKLSAIF